MTRLAIFDCDGTLVDSGHSIHTALAETFARHDRAVPPQEEAKRVVGLSLPEAMAFLAPDAETAEHAALAATYRDVFVGLRAAKQVDEPLFDGIVPLLDALGEDGWLLAVATGKSDRGLRHCLTAHGLHARFNNHNPSDDSQANADESTRTVVGRNKQQSHSATEGDRERRRNK